MDRTLLERIVEAIDRRHAEDPAGREAAYARAMSGHLEALQSVPSDALRIAVRAQHFERWLYPRSDFPPGRQGYLRWRAEAARRQAEAVGTLLESHSVDDATTKRVQSLMMKRNRLRDPEVQTLEDCACLVFLESELPRFAAGREPRRVVEILRRTWRKMSETGRRRALELPIDRSSRDLLEKAVGW
ncbi:MAG: DUF4202 domain-containing protein [Gammaproteobacteria bacterium]|nr:DUF4202 domain-containing protein [Gammaproteobacteria bacterium]